MRNNRAVDDLAEGLVTNLSHCPSGQQMRSPRRPRSPGVPRRPGSPEKPALHLGVIYALAGVQFRQPTLYLRQEDEPLASTRSRSTSESTPSENSSGRGARSPLSTRAPAPSPSERGRSS